MHKVLKAKSPPFPTPINKQFKTEIFHNSIIRMHRKNTDLASVMFVIYNRHKKLCRVLSVIQYNYH